MKNSVVLAAGRRRYHDKGVVNKSFRNNKYKVSGHTIDRFVCYKLHGYSSDLRINAGNAVEARSFNQRKVAHRAVHKDSGQADVEAVVGQIGQDLKYHSSTC